MHIMFPPLPHACWPCHSVLELFSTYKICTPASNHHGQECSVLNMCFILRTSLRIFAFTHHWTVHHVYLLLYHAMLFYSPVPSHSIVASCLSSNDTHDYDFYLEGSGSGLMHQLDMEYERNFDFLVASLVSLFVPYLISGIPTLICDVHF